MIGVNDGVGAAGIGEAGMNELRTEYEQTWQDFRHRTTVQMTVLSVYFATVAGLLYTFAQHRDAMEIGVVIGSVGIVLSIGALLLLLGERRAWSADVTRLRRLESILSNEGEHPNRLERIRRFDYYWLVRGYSLHPAGSFFWFLAIVVITGALLGGVLVFALAEVVCPSCSISIVVLCSIIVGLLLLVMILYVAYKTTRNSAEEILRRR